MANPAAVIGLTYRGVDVQDADFGIFLQLVRGLEELPSVRGEDTIIPWRPGRIAGTRVLDVLPLVLEGIVTGAVPSAWTDPFVDPMLLGDDAGSELSSYRAKAKDLRALFDPTVTGPLVANLEDGTTVSIQARTLPPTLWDHVLPVLSRVNIQLESVDPDWVVI